MTEVLVRSRRRCAFCFGLFHRNRVVNGQVAHLDRNAANNDPGNLVWLCLDHHDQYDSRTSQSKGLTESELRHYREDLYRYNEVARQELEPSASYVFLSAEGTALASHLNTKSQHGRTFDPQVPIDALRGLLGLTPEQIELAVDELREHELIEVNGSNDIVFATDRLFWETDAIFGETDPALDAQVVAKLIVAHPSDYVDLRELAENLGWPPRRLNPAATYLVRAGLVGETAFLGAAPYAVRSLVRTPKTKRYVRDLPADAAAPGGVQPSSQLSAEATELLRAAAADPDGELRLVPFDGGPGLLANGRDYLEGKRGRDLATWKDGFAQLVAGGLLCDEAATGHVFAVTKAGYALADRLQTHDE